MLEMRDERRTHLDQQCLELGVGGPGDERLVDRVEHRLVIGDLVVDVGLSNSAPFRPLSLATFLSPPAFRLWLVGLSAGVTFSFAARSAACLLTPV